MLAFDSNRASHLLDQLLANTKAKAYTVSVLTCVFFNGIEINKELRNALLRHAAAEILNYDVK